MAIVRQRALDFSPRDGVEQPTLPGALGLIPKTQARAIALAHLDGLTQGEVATQLGLPLEAVRGRMRRGLEALRP
ncbi:MAG: hypothetical protein H0X42_10940 [Solirubrobacterales bacterium]|nr:hypothetical protein [Solirubrobacterales bacterium]